MTAHSEALLFLLQQSHATRYHPEGLAQRHIDAVTAEAEELHRAVDAHMAEAEAQQRKLNALIAAAERPMGPAPDLTHLSAAIAEEMVQHINAGAAPRDPQLGGAGVSHTDDEVAIEKLAYELNIPFEAARDRYYASGADGLNPAV